MRTSGKFDRVPVEEGTIILYSQEMKLGDYDVLYQKWHWEGITAESVIFVNDDIANLSAGEIEAEIRASALMKAASRTTLKHTDSSFTFINFNFATE